ncbi:HAD-like protein [Zopfia rhizophila CBS 207.26]|uniref:Mitochondrial import inner membrane translocase subunit TIM50 n=1 Tax=Zopfia rhizophila CBS 207.26 TaxID=1314779 RepID=A0A6A6DWT1_9PEZI|nr:HAD-like protein [Zopfia rhizophila CBS 207.26]
MADKDGEPAHEGPKQQNDAEMSTTNAVDLSMPPLTHSPPTFHLGQGNNAYNWPWYNQYPNQHHVGMFNYNAQSGSVMYGAMPFRQLLLGQIPYGFSPYGFGFPPSYGWPQSNSFSRSGSTYVDEYRNQGSEQALADDGEREGDGGVRLHNTEYDTLHSLRASKSQKRRINKKRRTVSSISIASHPRPRNRPGSPKIHRPAPSPSQAYLRQASRPPNAWTHAQNMLVILDVNGTLVHRPSCTMPTHFIARPFLKPFLKFLFDNFSVMVWSSAKPKNVCTIVRNVLDEELQSMLLAVWSRKDFDLTPDEYISNVQVYKQLTWVWEDELMQQQHPAYRGGYRWGQHNTVLIDDSTLKASAQPHNLLEIPEFEATPEQLKGDVLREVAGYLRVLQMQVDVSCFIKKEPFKADERWTMEEWGDNGAEGGIMEHKVSLRPTLD